MKNIKNILKERASGLFLLLFAALIVAGFSLNSSRAESRNEQDLAVETQTSDENQVLGEMNISDEVTEENDFSLQERQETHQEASQEKKEGVKEETGRDDKKTTDEPKKNIFEDLNNRLGKYCHKSGSSNKKKCEESCSETKKASKKEDVYEDLYEKYCKIETTIVIKNKGGKIIAKYNKYRYNPDKDLTVFDFMKMASKDEKFSFKYETYSFGVFIYEINGIGSKVYDGNYWRLSINGKMSNKGASECEVSDGDKIEWEYTDEY